MHSSFRVFKYSCFPFYDEENYQNENDKLIHVTSFVAMFDLHGYSFIILWFH